MEDPMPNPAAERIGKADDCRISERLAHIQLTSFNLLTILGMPAVNGMIAPVLPAVMPRSVMEADKLQVLEDGGLLGSRATLTEMVEGDEDERARSAFAWLEGLRERVKAQQQTCEQRAVICDRNEGLGELQGLTRVPSKGRRMSKPTPQKPVKKLRIVVHPPTTEHEEGEIHSAPIVCQSKRTAQLKGEALPIPAERTLRTSASFPVMSKTSHRPSGLSESLQQRTIQHPTDLILSTGELTRNVDLEPKTTEHQAHLNAVPTVPSPSLALIPRTGLPQPPAFAPASPPSAYLSPRSHYLPIHQPFHWTSHLSTTLHTWLSHPDTRAIQHPIQELTLTASAPQPWSHEPAPPGGARLLSQFEGVVRHEMKLMRILLPASVSQEFADRDWVVLSCTQRPVPATPAPQTPATRPSTSVLRPRINPPPTSPSLLKKETECAPYFLLAIPISALRTWSVTYPHSASLAPPPMQPVYPYDSSSDKAAATDVTPKDPTTRPHRTRMLVHSPGTMPLVHGKGTSPALLMDWVGAVARGQGGGGICEVRSLGAVPVGGDVVGA